MSRQSSITNNEATSTYQIHDTMMCGDAAVPGATAMVPLPHPCSVPTYYMTRYDGILTRTNDATTTAKKCEESLMESTR